MKRLALSVLLAACGGEDDSDTPRHCDTIAEIYSCAAGWCAMRTDTGHMVVAPDDGDGEGDKVCWVSVESDTVAE